MVRECMKRIRDMSNSTISLIIVSIIILLRGQRGGGAYAAGQGTPLDELLSQRYTCTATALDHDDIETARLEWGRCIDQFILQPNPQLEEYAELQRYYAYFCRDAKEFKRCWGNITKLLNSCDKGRGAVAEKMYFTIYDLTCRDGGAGTAENIIRSVDFGELCRLEEGCSEKKEDWYSLDICRRYSAQASCEQSSISNCNNTVHKRVLMDNFKEIGIGLNCRSSVPAPTPAHANAHVFKLGKLPLIIPLLILGTITGI